MQDPIKLLEFVQQVARQANVPYDIHAQVEQAVNLIKKELNPTQEKQSSAV